jgi:hypothetical protein
MAGSTRVVSLPLKETGLLGRFCNKAERERYFVFGESWPPASVGRPPHLREMFSLIFGVPFSAGWLLGWPIAVCLQLR